MLQKFFAKQIHKPILGFFLTVHRYEQIASNNFGFYPAYFGLRFSDGLISFWRGIFPEALGIKH
jgi:hypothetical protein